MGPEEPTSPVTVELVNVTAPPPLGAALRTAKLPADHKAGAVLANAAWNGTAERSTANKTMATSLDVSMVNVCVRNIRFFIVCLLKVKVFSGFLLTFEFLTVYLLDVTVKDLTRLFSFQFSPPFPGHVIKPNQSKASTILGKHQSHQSV